MSDSETQIWDEAENNLSEAPLAENENLDDAMDNLFPDDDAPPLEESIAQMQDQGQAEAPADETSLEAEVGESTPEASVAIDEGDEAPSETDQAEVSEESWDEAPTDEDSAEISEGEASPDESVAEENWDEAPADESMPEDSEGEASTQESLVEASDTEVSAETVEDPIKETAGVEVENFNLAALTALVDDIRSESERVSEMKDTVAKALSLIQEMTDSLKS